MSATPGDEETGRDRGLAGRPPPRDRPRRSAGWGSRRSRAPPSGWPSPPMTPPAGPPRGAGPSACSLSIARSRRVALSVRPLHRPPRLPGLPPGRVALYSRSGHSRTLTSVSRRRLARDVDGKSVPDPALPGVTWSFRLRGGRLYIERRAPSNVEECVAEYAFGSGFHATTFVNVIDAATPAILEHRMTYFARDKSFGLTPGHEGISRSPGMDPLGGLPPPRDARFCFECHSTQVSTHDVLGIEEDRLIPNVSCERCHGPGRSHVEAARRGADGSELRLLFGPERGYTAQHVIELCGMCHRHPGKPGVGPLDPDNPRLARFQPVGVLQSRCFRESRGAFSCVTCHDPHARASTDRVAYNTTCRSCHSGEGYCASSIASERRYRTPRSRRPALPDRAGRRLRRLPHAPRRCRAGRPLCRPLDPGPTPRRSAGPSVISTRRQSGYRVEWRGRCGHAVLFERLAVDGDDRGVVGVAHDGHGRVPKTDRGRIRFLVFPHGRPDRRRPVGPGPRAHRPAARDEEARIRCPRSRFTDPAPGN